MLSRRSILKLTAAGASFPTLLSACGNADSKSAAKGPRPLTVTYYDWILNLHSDIESGVNKDFSATCQMKGQVAPVQGFGIERFVAETRDKMSSWDVYVGMTPFVEMAALVDAGVIEPWDKYIPKEVLDDIMPAVREEATFNGKLYSWPFFIDVIVQGWNCALVEKAGLDPAVAPKTWDEFIANAKKIVESKAAPFG